MKPYAYTKNCNIIHSVSFHNVPKERYISIIPPISMKPYSYTKNRNIIHSVSFNNVPKGKCMAYIHT